MTDPIITVRDLSKSYGARRVLAEASLDVHAGEIFGIAGRNGMGKTTLVEIIQGLRPRDAGRVLVNGIDPARHRARLRGFVGSQLQSSGLPDRLRVDEALQLFAALAGDVVDWRSLRDEWGLNRLGRAPFGSLSGGERQRVFLALALANRPRVVFLDELTHSLDPVARLETWQLVREVRDRGATVVLVTHDMEEADRLCDRVAVLHEGRIAALGSPEELVSAAGGGVLVRFTAGTTVTTTLQDLAGVRTVTSDGVRTTVVGDPGSVFRVAAELARREVAPQDFTVTRPRLEEVFVELTSAREDRAVGRVAS